MIGIQINPLDYFSKSFKYKMNIFYGINKAYCFVTEEENLLVEYNYIDEQQILYKDYELNEYDGNGLVKRIVLINCPIKLLILNKRVSFLTSIFNYSDNFDLNSFEFTDCNFKKLLFGVKMIKAKEKFTIIQNMKEQKQKLENLFNELKELRGKKIEEKKIYIELFSKYDIKEYIVNFSQKKKFIRR